ncbi:MAG TPA: hypothetical protein VMU50_23365 [Polyangia bacterium]|nr:hypothetical protein [Polyangia bacterium]
MGVVGATGIACLAVVETTLAVLAPTRAPREEDWRAVSAAVRVDFRPGDLIVAAPEWADVVMRQHLGDLIPLATAGRLDGARFARVWEVSQGGARGHETGAVAYEQRFGNLTLRRLERPAATVAYDFVERWTDAGVRRVDQRTGREIACAMKGDRILCPDVSWNYVRRQTVEVDTHLHQALLAQPVAGSTVVIEFPAATLGREITLATGMNDVWARKAARGTVDLQVAIDGHPRDRVTTRNESGWLITHVDTSAFAGKTVAVRFEITSPAPYQRQFVFAAEARL